MMKRSNDQSRLEQAHQTLQRVWENGWSREDFSPSWKIAETPREIQDAVDQKWFPPGAAVVDIGCGSGELAAWLADRNFRVLGIEISPSAIGRAMAAYGTIPGRLEFRVHDVCREPWLPLQCDVLIDRGCFHGLPRVFHPAYVRTVAAWSKPGARFLLLCGINHGVRQETGQEEKLRHEIAGLLEAQFRPKFDIVWMEATVIERRPPHRPALGLAARMIRTRHPAV